MLAVAAVLLGGVVLALFLQNRKNEKRLREQQGHHRIQVAVEFVSREVAAVRSDLLYLAEQGSLREFLSGTSDGKREDIEREYSAFISRKGIYDQIRCLDTSGKEILRVNYRDGHPRVVRAGDLQNKADRYYFRQSLQLKRGEVFVSDFDLNVERQAIERPLKPVVRFVTPVFAESGEKRGVLVMNYLGSHLLRRLSETSIPGMTLLVNSHGEYLRGPRANDAWGWLLHHTRTYAAQFPGEWKQTRHRASGQFLSNEGLFTFQHIVLSVSSLPKNSPDSVPEENRSKHTGTSLLVVSYLPRDEVYSASRKLLGQLSLMAVGGMAFVVILTRYWARSATVREEQAKQIVKSESRLRTLSSQLLTAQEAERRSISRELHDKLGQQVTAISLDLQLAARQNDPDRAKTLQQRAIDEVEQLLSSLHDTATRLRPAVLDDLGLREAIESYVADFHQRTGIVVNATLNLGSIAIPSSIGENAFRIIQEALTNVAKYARVDEAHLSVKADSKFLQLEVRDDGAGFQPGESNTTQLGLLGIQERVDLLGGTFQLRTAPDDGTRIEVSLPLHAVL